MSPSPKAKERLNKQSYVAFTQIMDYRYRKTEKHLLSKGFIYWVPQVSCSVELASFSQAEASLPNAEHPGHQKNATANKRFNYSHVCFHASKKCKMKAHWVGCWNVSFSIFSYTCLTLYKYMQKCTHFRFARKIFSNLTREKSECHHIFFQSSILGNSQVLHINYSSFLSNL